MRSILGPLVISALILNEIHVNAMYSSGPSSSRPNNNGIRTIPYNHEHYINVWKDQHGAEQVQISCGNQSPFGNYATILETREDAHGKFTFVSYVTELQEPIAVRARRPPGPEEPNPTTFFFTHEGNKYKVTHEPNMGPVREICHFPHNIAAPEGTHLKCERISAFGLKFIRYSDSNNKVYSAYIDPDWEQPVYQNI